MNLRTALRRRDADWLQKVHPELERMGYPLPLSNKEIKAILSSPEDRKEIMKIIKKELS